MPDTTNPTMRAKMYVTNVASSGVPATSETIGFAAVTGAPADATTGVSEDNTYARYTPMATASFTVNNPKLLGEFQQGDTFYVDFTRVAKPQLATASATA